MSVLLPVLNEAGTIDACLGSLLAQDYPGPLEVLVAEGGSADGTAARLAAVADAAGGRVRVVANPQRHQAPGLNLLARLAEGSVLVRADAHSLYAADYVRRSVVALRETGATAVGGRLVPEGRTPWQEAVARAMRSPLGVGPGRFHHGSPAREEVDTVYLGAWRREDFLALGGFRSLPSGAAEDADLYWRMRRAGGRVVLDPAIRSRYLPRATLAGFARQNWRYGQAKGEMLWLNGEFPSWRPLAPLALVAALTTTTALALTGRPRWPLAMLLGAWTAVLTSAALPAPTPATATRTATATATMHLTYGLGLTTTLLRGPAAVRREAAG